MAPHPGPRGVVRPLLALLAAAGVAAAASEPVGQPQSPAAAAREARIAAQLAANPGAVPTLGDWSSGLPNVDARYTADGQPSAAASAARADFDKTPAGKARAEAKAKLIASLPEMAIDDDAALGTPHFVRSTRVFLTDPAPGLAPIDVAARYVHDHAALFEISPLELFIARTARDFKTDHNGVTHLTFNQQILTDRGGVDLFDCHFQANVMPDGRLINVGSTMLPRDGMVITAHKLSPEAAVRAAAAACGVPLSSTVAPAEAPTGPEQRTVWNPIPELRSDEPVVSSLIYFPLTRTDIRAAYAVSIPVRGVGHHYDVIIDATAGSERGGRLLHRVNRLVFDSTQPVTMRVYTSDGVAPMSPGTPTPSGDQAPLATRQLVTINPADVLPVNQNGWINDNTFETIGNNVDAHLDLDTNNTPDTPRPNGGPTRTFDFPLDPTQAPQTYAAASVVQMFYFCNVFHDRLYALGFNEVARNFQFDNFGRGGSGNDRILADTQDGNGVSPNINNANFSTQNTDGSTGRVQMYIFNGPNPDRDGSLDGDIVYHELAHGLSIRLHAAAQLSSVQSRSMGEGWSDFFGIALLAEPTDDPTANYTTGGYTTYQLGTPSYITNYYFGIRRFPYSTNLSVNPLTFADMDPAQYSNPPSVPISPLVGVALSSSANAVHNVGEIWCNILLETRALLWARDGFPANELLMRLVVDGMKLDPANPTLLQARDSILQADMVNHASANRTAIWTAFAKRGLGFGAVCPAASTTAGAVESYQLPFRATFTYPDGIPSELDPGAATSFRVRIIGEGLTITSGDASLVHRVDGGEPITTTLVPTGEPDEYTVTLPPSSCYQRLTFNIRTGTSLGDRVDPAVGSYAADVFTGRTTVVFHDFETDTGWTIGPDTATSGNWVRADPVGTTAQPENDNTPAPGVACWVTGNGTPGGAVGEADIDNGATVLTSPAFDLSGLTDARVSYARWFSNGGGGNPFQDTLKVDVSTDNGANWTRAETVGPGNSPDTQPGWRNASWTLGQFGLAPTSQVRIRITADDLPAAGSVVEAAFDDFRIESIDCTPPTCVADFNQSGAVSLQDIFDYFTAYFSGNLTADINDSGDLTVQDVFDFLAAYFTGC